MQVAILEVSWLYKSDKTTSGNAPALGDEDSAEFVMGRNELLVELRKNIGFMKDHEDLP